MMMMMMMTTMTMMQFSWSHIDHDKILVCCHYFSLCIIITQRGYIDDGNDNNDNT